MYHPHTIIGNFILPHMHNIYLIDEIGLKFQKLSISGWVSEVSETLCQWLGIWIQKLSISGWVSEIPGTSSMMVGIWNPWMVCIQYFTWILCSFMQIELGKRSKRKKTSEQKPKRRKLQGDGHTQDPMIQIGREIACELNVGLLWVLLEIKNLSLKNLVMPVKLIQ